MATIHVNIEIFPQDDGTGSEPWWVLATGELFGPFDNQDKAIDALPAIVRGLP